MWGGPQRTHLELRDLDPKTREREIAAIEEALSRLPGVRWARALPHLGHVVVDHDATVISAPKLEDNLERIEKTLAVAGQPFPVRQPERHPGHRQPINRTYIEIGLDVWALGMGIVLRRVGKRVPPTFIDLFAAVAVIEGVPEVRKAIERVLGIAATEMAIDISQAVLRPIIQSDIGSLSGIAQRALQLRELDRRRKLWARWEPQLCSEPEHFPRAVTHVDPRPRERPPGPIERYSGKAIAAFVGAFGAGLVSTADLEGAVGMIFGGVPRPAAIGREAFASHLGSRLADAGLLVLDPHALRRLDRIDCVVVEATLASDEHPRHIRDAAAQSGLAIYGCRNAPTKTVRDLQNAGCSVAYFGTTATDAYAAADFSVGVVPGKATHLWDAHVLCHSSTQAAMVVFACGLARKASEQSVALAGAEALWGIGLMTRGVRRETTRKIMQSAGATTILALANGVRLAQRVPKPPPAIGPPPPPWHAMDLAAVFDAVKSGPSGLDENQAASRRKPPPKAKPASIELGRLVIDELATPITPVLTAGAGLAALVGGFADAGLIMGVLGANAVFGASQRFRTERALSALSKHAERSVRVRRDGELREVVEGKLVAGDVIELAAGDEVPADARLLEANGLEVDESALTGESLPVVKKVAAIAKETPVPERDTMLYQGTAVAAGFAVAVVVAAGADTESQRALSESTIDGSRTGVERRLESLTRLTLPVAGAAGVALVGTGLLSKRPLRDVIGAGVGLAVAAVPEGLPLLATMAQLAAANRLSARGAHVRNPRAMEALGRVDVVCADKTGTLTEGRIRLALVSDGTSEQPVHALDERRRNVLAVALRASASGENGPITHLTDQALVEGGKRAGVARTEGLSDWSYEQELPFEPSRGFQAGLGRHNGGRWLDVKGAPELIVPRCAYWLRDGRADAIDDAGRERLLAAANRLARRGFRVLAVAGRKVSKERKMLDETAIANLVFHGFVALADTVRPTARAAITSLALAGVRVLMVTGDHPSTAASIAVELGLCGDVLTGNDIDALTDDALARALSENIQVLARVTPQQKLRIVRALKASGRVVAMTGDGANDAPAIRLADVGVALGERATEAARGAADVVIGDDRIETLVHAVLEGRALWTSVRDAVSLLVGGNLGEIAFSFAAGIASGRSPLNARQLLLVNLVTDTLPALVIATRPPRHKNPEELLREGPETSLGRALKRDILWRAGITSAAAGSAWLASRFTSSRKRASTVGLLALTGSQLAQTIVESGWSWPVIMATTGSAAVLLAVIEVPGLSQFFGCCPLGPLGLAQAGLATAAATGAALLLPGRTSQ